MRVVSSLLIIWLSSLVSAQEGGMENDQQEQQKIPTTLSEAHAELERILSPEELGKIDAMPSEDGMIQYHMGLGAGIRSSWGLWRGSPLAKHMQELGFTHPDDMSSVILATFWCKRHGQDLRLEERAAASRESMEIARKIEEEKEDRIQKANAAVQNMMMGLQFEKRDVPVVLMPIRSGLSVRFMCRLRDGVFLTAYHQGIMQPRAVGEGIFYDPADAERRANPQYDDYVARGYYSDPADGELRKMKPGQDFYTRGYFLDPADRKIRRVCVPEVNEVYAAVAVGGRAWFAGLTDGKAVLAGVGTRDRIVVPLPQEDEIPDLGIDGESVLGVYSKTIYRLTDQQWTLVHSGDTLLPRSGLPPQRHGNMVFLRDEGRHETGKRLWWLTVGDKSHLRLLARDTGLFDPIVRHGPDWVEIHSIGYREWEETSSYCVTSNGDLWACVGNGSFLFRRSKDGSYSIAIVNNSVQFTGDLLGKREADHGLYVSAVTALPDDTLLVAGQTGLYRLRGNELIQELAFTREKVVDRSGRAHSDSWTPNTVLSLDDQSYVIGTAMWDGVYLLRKGDDGRWSCLPLDRVRDTVLW